MDLSSQHRKPMSYCLLPCTREIAKSDVNAKLAAATIEDDVCNLEVRGATIPLLISNTTSAAGRGTCRGAPIGQAKR